MSTDPVVPPAVNGPQVDVIEIVAPPYGHLDVVADRLDVAVFDLVTEGPQGLQGVQGVQGVEGPQGEQGVEGPPGQLFEQTFAVEAYEWVAEHNLDTYPVVQTFDSNGDEIVGDIRFPDRNHVVVSFMVPFSGVMRLKA